MKIKLSVRLKLTILSILLLAFCCIVLTIVLNFSAYQMAKIIEAVPIVTEQQLSASTVTSEAEGIDEIPAILMTPVQTAKRSYLNESVFYMLFVIAIGGIITYYIAGRVLKPLSELSGQMKNRTVHNLSETFPVPKSQDELSDLAMSFNEMSAKLNEAFAMQKRFSQSAAHELRTPLTVLKTKVEVFKKKEHHTDEEYTKLLDVVTKHTNRLADLVKDLLELTNMNAIECTTEIKVKTMLNSVIKELSPISERENITVNVSGDERKVFGNEGLLRRAFYNLIVNAINYNTENGSVELSILGGESWTIITVTDTGIGIPLEQCESIFEPFFRVDKSRSRKNGGVGLGLSIVKSIIDQHGGEIEVAPNPDGGTIFTVTLLTIKDEQFEFPKYCKLTP